MTRIPSEDLYAFRIDSQIESYFCNIGYNVRVVFKPTRPEESKLGFDSLFQDSKRVKYFALQHKRPHAITNKGVIKFHLNNRKQYEILHRNKEWMFYSFPLFIKYNLLKTALYHTVFASADFWNVGSQSLMVSVYPWCICSNRRLTPAFAWGILSKTFISCEIGKVEEKVDRVKGLLMEEYPLDDYTLYVFDLDNKKGLIVKKHSSKENE